MTERRNLSFFGRLTRTFHKYNPFTIDLAINKVVKTVDDLVCKVDSLHTKISQDIEELERLNENKDLIVSQIVNCLPDMVWFKDINGKYLIANQAIRSGLLMCNDPIGKGDVELANLAKLMYGAENHTFGEKCANSDLITLERDKPSRFLESGKVKGKMLYLEVFKAVVKDSDGNVLGVCGAGRDMTWYVEALKDSDGTSGKISIPEVFKKYEFGEDTV